MLYKERLRPFLTSHEGEMVFEQRSKSISFQAVDEESFCALN